MVKQDYAKRNSEQQARKQAYEQEEQKRKARMSEIKHAFPNLACVVFGQECPPEQESNG